MSGKQYSTTGSASPFSRRRNSLRPFSFGRFCLRPPEPKVSCSNHDGDTSHLVVPFRANGRRLVPIGDNSLPYLPTPSQLMAMSSCSKQATHWWFVRRKLCRFVPLSGSQYDTRALTRAGLGAPWEAPFDDGTSPVVDDPTDDAHRVEKTQLAARSLSCSRMLYSNVVQILMLFLLFNEEDNLAFPEDHARAGPRRRCTLANRCEDRA